MAAAVMNSQQLADILLNRMSAEDACTMVTTRSDDRAKASQIVAALPPGIEQRTPAWYAARKGMLTASEFKTAGADKVSQSYVLGKVFPQPFCTNEAMTWGCRFEDLACATYELEMDTKVHEYGLLIHPDASWIGASPDGITAYGVLIEIKCPFSRKHYEIEKRVTDERLFPKNDKANLHGRYFSQVQGQLEVCDLELCDFAVAHIDEIESNMFWQLRRVSDARYRYAVVVDVPKPGHDDGSVAYRTSPLELDDDALRAWLAGVLSVAPDARVWYAHVRELGIERVERDREYWAKLREGLGRTKDAINEIMSGAAKQSGDAKPFSGNPSLFGPEDESSDFCGGNNGPPAQAKSVGFGSSGKSAENRASKTPAPSKTPASMFSLDDD